jgi:hypothetical protein
MTTDRANQLEAAISGMLAASEPQGVHPPHLVYNVPTRHMTVLSRMVRDGCTLSEACDGDPPPVALPALQLEKRALTAREAEAKLELVVALLDQIVASANTSRPGVFEMDLMTAASRARYAYGRLGDRIAGQLPDGLDKDLARC